MKIELSHDILANNIYDKASTDDKMLLKVASFIKGRYEFYLERNALLSNEDINYISPYVQKIELSKEEKAFYNKSRYRIKARWVAFIGTGFVVSALLFALSIWAINSRRIAVMQRNRAEHKTIELEKANDSISTVNIKFEKEKAARLQVLDSLEEQGIQLSTLEMALIASNEALKRSRDSLEQLLALELKLKAELKKSLANEQAARAKERQLNAQLESTNAKLEAANRRLEDDEKKAQSRALSARALFVLRQNDDRKLAAQLASESYLLDKSNKEACGVLAELTGKGSDYFQRYSPPGSYEEMINKLKKNYGTLDTKDKYKYLRGMPTEILQNKTLQRNR